MSTIAHADAAPSPLGKGVLEIIGCQMIWGFMPIYWKLLSGVSALLVLDARMIFSGVLMLALAAFVKRMRAGATSCAIHAPSAPSSHQGASSR